MPPIERGDRKPDSAVDPITNKITLIIAATLLAAGLAPAATASVSPTQDIRPQLTAARTRDDTEVIGYGWLDCLACQQPPRLRGEPDGS